MEYEKPEMVDFDNIKSWGAVCERNGSAAGEACGYDGIGAGTNCYLNGQDAGNYCVDGVAGAPVDA